VLRGCTNHSCRGRNKKICLLFPEITSHCS
jgi:hypothetical protein